MTLPASENRRHIHFGIICSGTTLPAWQAKCLHKLLALNDVKSALLILVDDSGIASNSWQESKDVRHLFWRLYSSWVNRGSNAMRPVDMSTTLAYVPRVRCKVTSQDGSPACLSEADIVEIRAYHLDFILCFDFDLDCEEILSAARLGVWSFHYGDEDKYPGGPPGFWEIYTGDCVTGAALRRITGQTDAGIVLRRGRIKTSDTSYVRNRDTIYLESAEWPAQVCTDIRNGCADYVYASPSPASATVFQTPNDAQMIRFLLRIAGNFFFNLYGSLLFYEHWNIGIVDKPIHAFLDPRTQPQARWLPLPARTRFFADPFAICQDGVVQILFEDYDYGTAKGCISTISMRGEAFSPSRTVMAPPFHTSYPYLFEHLGQIYCVPETYQAREVSLYRAEEFPNRWVKVAILIEDLAGLDSTVFQHEGRWWLMATDQDDGPNHKLKAWYAPELLGPWKPHAANPVKVDARSARPAGTPFIYNGHLYRPAQDSSREYGGRVILNRVLRLTPTEFREEQAVVVEPDEYGPYSDGLHTLSSVGDMTVIDGRKKVFALKNLPVLIHNLRHVLELRMVQPLVRPLHALAAKAHKNPG